MLAAQPSRARPITVNLKVQPGATGQIAAGALFATAAAALFVGMDTIAKHLGQSLPVPMIYWGRYTFHLAVLLVLLPFLGWRNVGQTTQRGRHLFRGLFVALATICAFNALQHLPLADMYAIGYTAPLMVTVLAIPLLGERVGFRRWIAVFVGLLGVLIVIRPGLTSFNIGTLFAVGMALAFALYQLITRSAKRTDGPFVGLFYAALIGAVLANAMAPFSWQTPTAGQLVGLMALGCLGAAGHFMLIMALRGAEASFVSLFTYTQIPWSILVGGMVFGDRPDPYTLIGASVVIGAGLFVFWRERVVARRGG